MRNVALILIFATATLIARPMPWKSKGELLVTGYVSDTLGYRYNVLIVPGYIQSVDLFKNQFKTGANHQFHGLKMVGIGLRDIPLSAKYLGGYFTRKPWVGMRDGARDMADGTEFFITDFIGEGIPKTWRKYMGSARTLRERGTIGWRISYPFFFVRSMINTTLRISGGTIATAGCIAYGTVLRPSYELIYPIGKTVGYMGYNTGKTVFGTGEITWGAVANYVSAGLIAPVSITAWNTVIGVPLSLISAVPTPQSTHRMWVTIDKEPSLNDAGKSIDLETFNEAFNLYCSEIDSCEKDSLRIISKFQPNVTIIDSSIAEKQQELDSLKRQIYTLQRQRDSVVQDTRDSIRIATSIIRSNKYKTSSVGQSEFQEYWDFVVSNQPDSAEIDTAKLDQFIKRFGGNFITKSNSAVQSNQKKYTPTSLIGNEVDAIIDGDFLE